LGNEEAHALRPAGAAWARQPRWRMLGGRGLTSRTLSGLLQSMSTEQLQAIGTEKERPLQEELLGVLKDHEKEMQNHFQEWVSDLRRMQSEHAKQCNELTRRLQSRCDSRCRPPELEHEVVCPPGVPPPMALHPAWMEPSAPSTRPPEPGNRQESGNHQESAPVLLKKDHPPAASARGKSAPTNGASTAASARRFSDPINLLYGAERNEVQQITRTTKSSKTLKPAMTGFHAPRPIKPNTSVEEGPLRRFMKSVLVRSVCSGMILANALFMGWHSDVTLQALVRDEEHIYHPAFAHTELFFCVFFTVELVLRLFAEKRDFIFSEEAPWNLFDTFLVLLSLLDLVLSSITDASTLNLTFARTLRIFRFARILRIVRVMRFFYSFRLMVYSVLYSMVSLLWVFIMLVFVMYFFSIFFLHAVSEHFRTEKGANTVNEELRGELVALFGSLLRTLTSLFMSISGGIDWGDVMDPLTDVHWSNGVVFLFYIFFMIFGVLNVVMASFVDSASQISRRDRELVTQNEMEKVAQYAQNIRRFFHEADEDNTGTLSWDEFRDYLKHEKVKHYFQSFELDVSQARTLFKLLDLDESDDVGIDEFVEGCMRMKGSARSIDVNMLLYETEKMIDKQITFMGFVEEQFQALWELQGVPPPVPKLPRRSRNERGSLSRTRLFTEATGASPSAMSHTSSLRNNVALLD